MNIRIMIQVMQIHTFNFKFLLALFCLLLVQIATAQTFENDQESEEISGDEIIIDNTNVNTQVLNDLGFETNFAPDPSTIVGNLVTIQQIGDLNNVSVSTTTASSDIAIIQNGNTNDIELSYTTNSVFARLNQQGNSNQVIDFVANPNADPALDLTQQGDNLSFERYGTNNLTNSLQFTQTEASPAIIVRSYQ